MKVKEWRGGRVCDICARNCGKILYDARTWMDTWAVMCQECFESEGVGLGTGYGQKYRLTDKGRYVKVAG